MERAEAREPGRDLAVTSDTLRQFATEARKRLRNGEGGFRRHYVQALVQRVEIADDEVRICGQPGRLLQTLTAASVGPDTLDVRGFEPRWLPGAGESQNYVHSIPLLQNGRSEGNRAGDLKKNAKALRMRPPSLRERGVALARERGIVTTKELQAVGVHRCYLSSMCDEGLLVRVGHGRYRLAQQPDVA